MARVPWLDEAALEFPALSEALDDPDGLLAAGGDLSEERLLLAYRSGIFPWFEDGQPILWWSPDPRAVFYPDRIHISRSLRKSLRKRDWRVTSDTAFEAVIAGCAALDQSRSGTWITADMQRAYTALFNSGWAHSVETWENGELIGGLYGIAINRIFFGESMFSRRADGSKIALVILAEHLHRQGYQLIDCQVGNPHLYRMGAQDLNRDQFQRILAAEYAGPISPPGRWHWSVNAGDPQVGHIEN